mgnify:CR=1 FL=1
MGKKSNMTKLVSKEKLPKLVYGLDGIMKLFNVSKATAWRYRHGCIEGACMQNGNIIVVNTEKALQLFAKTQKKFDDIVEKDPVAKEVVEVVQD